MILWEFVLSEKPNPFLFQDLMVEFIEERRNVKTDDIAIASKQDVRESIASKFDV